MTLEEWRNQLIDRCEMEPCNIPEMEKIISEIMAAEREWCAKLICKGCEAGKVTTNVDGDWMHPHDDRQHMIPCEAQPFLELRQA